MHIRPGTPDDLPTLAAIDALIATSPERLSEVAHAVVEQQVSVACVDDGPVGYLILHHAFFGNGFVQLLVVAPDRRRGGIGAALMRHARAICRTPKLFTSTNASNAPMQALLDRLGYLRCGTIDGLDDDDPEWVYLHRAASDGPASL